MTNNLEWGDNETKGWYLMDVRDGHIQDIRVVLSMSEAAWPRDEVMFYPVHKSSSHIRMAKPDGMSIDQIKDWALNQFLLIRES